MRLLRLCLSPEKMKTGGGSSGVFSTPYYVEDFQHTDTDVHSILAFPLKNSEGSVS